MVSIINELTLPKEGYFYSFNGEQHEYLPNLKKVNFFVGENNSGKSRLLRQILFHKLIYSSENLPHDRYNEAITAIRQRLEEYLRKAKINYSPINTALSNLVPYSRNDPKCMTHQNLKDLNQELSKLEKGSTSIDYIPTDKFVKTFRDIIDEEILKITSTSSLDREPEVLKKIYIPILRGLRTFSNHPGGDQLGDIYQKRTMDDYFVEPEDQIEIYTGLSAYELVRQYLLGDLKKRNSIRKFEEYLSKSFFNGKDIALIPTYNSNNLTIKIGAETERPIYQLGDGIQSLIILTLPMFLFKDEKVLFFIEEPEILLHPGFQRRYLEILIDSGISENHQFFFTTHSNHFLDISLDFKDTSIYILKKQFDDIGDSVEITPVFSIESVTGGDTSILDVLGVRNSSVFLSNCTIWVEGITDRMYLKHYLKLFYDYNKKVNKKISEYIEDYHYSFIEYAGGNVPHYSFGAKSTDDTIFADRICSKILLISDKDDKKIERHALLRKMLKENLYVLPCREIENLLSAGILKEIVEDYEGHSLSFDFHREMYRNEYLGSYIENKLGKNKTRLGKYAEQSGTITQKRAFCDKATEKISDWNRMTDDAKQLTERIYSFIAANNQ